MLHLLANPGAAPVTDFPWWIVLGIVCVVLVANIFYTVHDVAVMKNPLAWEDLFFLALYLLFAATVSAVPALIVGDVERSVQEDAWSQKVQHWLADDYGVSVNSDQVRTLSRGDQVVVTVGGHRVPLSVTSDGDTLVPSVGKVLLPTRSH